MASCAGAALRVGLVLAAVACGGKAAQDPLDLDMRGQRHAMGQKRTDPTCETGKPCPAGEMGESGEMAHMPPPLAKFHETLAPPWHAPHGPKRMADTCAAITAFHADAEAIAAAPPPDGGDAAAWSTGGRQLTEAVAMLDTTCKASDVAAFEPAFERVHKAFHGLLEAASGHPDEHGDHGDHDKNEH